LEFLMHIRVSNTILGAVPCMMQLPFFMCKSHHKLTKYIIYTSSFSIATNIHVFPAKVAPLSLQDPDKARRDKSENIVQPTQTYDVVRRCESKVLGLDSARPVNGALDSRRIVNPRRSSNWRERSKPKGNSLVLGREPDKRSFSSLRQRP